MNRKQIINCLQQLGDYLDAQGLQGEILLTGGASMCLIHEARDMTKDIDALYEPKDIINKYAAIIAESEGLPKDWLNDSVKGFIGTNAPIVDFISFKGLHVQTVSAEYLLAMKLMSARYGEKDGEDIRFLLGKLGITTKEEATKILLSFFSPNQILPKTQYVIEEAIESINEQQKSVGEKPSISERLKRKNRLGKEQNKKIKKHINNEHELE